MDRNEQQAQFDAAIKRVSGYKGGDPIFIHVEGWAVGTIGIVKSFCIAQGLKVKVGSARGKKTLRISR